MLTFSVDSKNQFKSIKGLFISRISVFLFLPFFIIFYNLDFPKEIFLVWIICIPTIYLHITYLANNWNTQLIVNDSNSFTIKNKQESHTFQYRDIAYTEKNSAIYFKNRIDNKGRRVALSSYYGYLKVKLKNGKIFYLTSLMIDIQQPPFSIDKGYYRCIPFLKKREFSLKEGREMVLKLRRGKIEHLKETFFKLSDDHLKDKINNPNLSHEAIIAAQEILSERNETNV